MRFRSSICAVTKHDLYNAFQFSSILRFSLGDKHSFQARSCRMIDYAIGG